MKHLIMGALAALCTLGAHAEGPVQPPLEVYGRLPDLVLAEISPDGERLALLRQMDELVEVQIYNFAANTITHRFDATDLKAHGLVFGSDEQLVVRASEATRMFGVRGDWEFSGAIAIDLERGKSIQMLSREDDIYPAQGGLGRIVGRLKSGDLLMPAYVGKLGADPNNFLLRATSNGRGFTHARGDRHTIDWFVDRKGDALVREYYHNEDDAYRAEFRDGDRWETFYEKDDTPEIPINIVAVGADDQSVLLIGVSEDSDGSYSSLTRLNFDGTMESGLFQKNGADIDEVLTDINRHILGVRHSGTTPSYDIRDPALKKNYSEVSDMLPGAMIEIASWSDDRTRVVYRIFDTSSVDTWIMHDSKTGANVLIGRSREAIPNEAIGRVYAISYKARDDLDIPAILTVPPGIDLNAMKPLPMIVMPHGGPATYDHVDFDWLAQFFANRGYLVLQPNFRGSTGFGDVFLKAGEGEWGGKMQDDVSDGVAAMIKAGYGDGQRVCIVGASYGGYSALAGGAFTPDLYDCVAAFAPVTDIAGMLRQEKSQMGRDHWAVAYWERIIAKGEASRDKLDVISPEKNADAFTAPVLLIHGGDDTVVNFDQSRDMERALKKAGKQVTLIKLKGGDHWLSDSETRLETLRALDRFVAEHIGTSG